MLNERKCGTYLANSSLPQSRVVLLHLSVVLGERSLSGMLFERRGQVPLLYYISQSRLPDSIQIDSSPSRCYLTHDNNSQGRHQTQSQ